MKFFSRHGMFPLLENHAFFSTRICDDVTGLSLSRDWQNNTEKVEYGGLFWNLKEKKFLR